MANPDAAKEPVKEAPAPKKGRDDDDDGEVKTAGPAQKQKFLPTGLSRSIVLAAVIASTAVLIGALFGGRYDLVPAPNSVNGFVYRIDHLTGAVQFCGPQGCSETSARPAP